MRYKKMPKKKVEHSIFQAAANQRGAILVIALLALVVLSVLGLAFMNISKTESDISYNDRDSSRGLYIADSGLERIKRDILYQATFPGSNTTGRYVASPAPAGDGTSSDNTGAYVSTSAPVTRYYDLGAVPSNSSTDPPTAAFWSSVSPLSAYQQTGLNGGSYSLKFATSSDGAFYVLSSGSVGTRVSRTLEAKYEVKDLSIWNNAIFGGTGATGAMVNGNVKIAGSVHIMGSGLAPTDTALSLGGTAGIINDYSGLSATLEPLLAQNSMVINALPGKLRAEYRCKSGKTATSGSASIGVSGTNVKGVYTNDGFASGASVYSDNGTNKAYDVPASLGVSFPMLDSPYPPNPALTYRQWLDANSLSVAVPKIDNTVASFSQSGGGNSISWNQGTGTLTINGVIKIAGNLDLAAKNNFVYYSGKGTIYSTGTVNIHDCVLPATNASFPTTNCIGIIANNDLEICIGGGESAARLAGAFYAQNRIVSAKQTQCAGTWVSNYFDLGSQVPKIYQVPLLRKNLPPGMPGSNPIVFLKVVYWREVT